MKEESRAPRKIIIKRMMKPGKSLKRCPLAGGGGQGIFSKWGPWYQSVRGYDWFFGNS